MHLDIVVRGPFFSSRIDEVVKRAILEELLLKVDQRIHRGGKGQGAKRNTITSEPVSALSMRFDTTTVAKGSGKWPRTKGTTWQRKNLVIIRAMAPRVARATARQIVADLGD